MSDEQYEEIMDMLTVIWKRIDTLERKLNGSMKNGSMKIADANQYLSDLKRQAERLKNS